MRHQDLNALLVNILGAADVVGLLNVRELGGKALSVKVFFSVSCLMRHDLVGN